MYMYLYIDRVPQTHSCKHGHLSAGTAGVVLAVLSLALDGAHMAQLGSGGVFGWLRRDYLLRGTYLSVGPGLFGHVGFNVGASVGDTQALPETTICCVRCLMGSLLSLP
jgi:hypothetical protein